MFTDGSQLPCDKEAEATHGEEPKPRAESPTALPAGSQHMKEPSWSRFSSPGLCPPPTATWGADGNVPTQPSLDCRHGSKIKDCCSLKPLSLQVICNIATDDKARNIVLSLHPFSSAVFFCRPGTRVSLWSVFFTSSLPLNYSRGFLSGLFVRALSIVNLYVLFCPSDFFVFVFYIEV